MAGFPYAAGWPATSLLTRPLFYEFAFATAHTFASQGFSPRISPCPAQVATCPNEQFTWWVPFIPQDQPGLSWRTARKQAVSLILQIARPADIRTFRKSAAGLRYTSRGSPLSLADSGQRSSEK